MGRKINGFSKWLNPQIFAFGIFQTRSLRANFQTYLAHLLKFGA